MVTKIRIGALISGGGTNLQAIIDSCESGKICGEIVFVGTDNPDAQGLKRAASRRIPTFVVDYKSAIKSFTNDLNKIELPDDFNINDLLLKYSVFPADADLEKTKKFLTLRAAIEKKLLDEMRPYPFDLLILAGFMRILSPYFIDKINSEPDNFRIMNIHPALLPAFPGLDGYGDTFRYGCKIGGCTVHFIDYGEDSGPIIGQRAFPIQENDTLNTIKKKGLALEWELYPSCIQMFAQNRLQIVKKIFELDSGEKVIRTVVKIKGES